MFSSHAAVSNRHLIENMDAGRLLLAAALRRDPTPASKVVFVWGNRLFCGYRREGGLDFPGGKAELAETPSECAQRELKEEVHLSSHALASLNKIRTPRACFLMQITDQQRYLVSIFVVHLASPGVTLTADGSRELSGPAWREVEEVLTNLSSSRVPVSAGCAYAAGLLAALRQAGVPNYPSIGLEQKQDIRGVTEKSGRLYSSKPNKHRVSCGNFCHTKDGKFDAGEPVGTCIVENVR